MSFVSNKFTSLLCAVGAGALLAACPDSGESPDARVPTEFDANTGPEIDAGIDAGGPDATDLPVGGTIAVLDVKISNNLGGTTIAGNAVSITYTDPDADEGTVTFGTPGTIGQCSVTVYDQALGETPAPAISDGAVGVAGATTPTIGGCAFVPTAGAYLCPAAAPAAIPAGTTISAPAGGLQNIVFPVGTTLPTDNVGRGIILSGLAGATNNTPAGSTFPIVSNTPANVITIANPTGVEDLTPAAAATFFILSGAGPTPAARDFLGATTEVVITKAAGLTPAVNQTFTAAGDGLVLADDSLKPEAMPKTAPAADLKVSCLATENGNCGAAGAGGIGGLIVTGRTTNGVVPGAAPPFFMPAPLATGKIATFTCTFTSSSGTVPAAAWAAVLATSPTRIETRVIRGRAVPAAAGGGTNLLVGHGLIGYTTLP